MTLTTPTVRYAGIVLGGASSFDWELRAGIAPVERYYNLSRKIANRLRPFLGTPNTLEIVGPRRTLTVRNVFLLEVLGSNDPYHRRIRLADVRWLLPKAWIKTSYNVRRQSALTRAVSPENNAIFANAVTEPQITYAPYSLRNRGSVWTSQEILKDVIDKAAVQIIGRGNLLFPEFRDPVLDEIEVEDLRIDGNGAEAVAQAFAEIPGYSMYANLEGNLVIFDTRKAPPIRLAAVATRAQTTGPYFARSDKSGIRPAAVNVLFTPEVEVLFRYQEASRSTASRFSADLSNVIRQPDPEAEVAPGELLARGSYYEIEDAWRLWGPFGFDNLPITHDVMRVRVFDQGTASFSTAWSAARPGFAYPSRRNLARTDASLDAWRRLLQVNRYFHGMVEEYRPFRASILNPQRNSHAPAEVYSDWIRRPDTVSAKAAVQGYRFGGWTARGFDGDIEGFEPAPCRVVIEDQAAGIFRLVPQNDADGIASQTQLGYPSTAFPSTFINFANRFRQMAHAMWHAVELEPNWKCGVLLTVVPAIRRVEDFARVRITPDAVGVSRSSRGPEVFVRVFPQVRTCRVPYSKDTDQRHVQAIAGDTQADWYAAASNKEEVFEIAKAAAARVYETLDDRFEGGAVIDLDPSAEPGGNVASVRHTMSAGATTTAIQFDRVTQATDLYRFLSPEVRRAVQGTLNNAPPWRTPRGPGAAP